jgi:hypothetical protein
LGGAVFGDEALDGAVQLGACVHKLAQRREWDLQQETDSGKQHDGAVDLHDVRKGVVQGVHLVAEFGAEDGGGDDSQA